MAVGLLTFPLKICKLITENGKVRWDSKNTQGRNKTIVKPHNLVAVGVITMTEITPTVLFQSNLDERVSF